MQAKLLADLLKRSLPARLHTLHVQARLHGCTLARLHEKDRAPARLTPLTLRSPSQDGAWEWIERLFG